MDDVVREIMRRVMPAGATQGDYLVIEAAVKAAVDITHEAGTFEGTVEAALDTLRDAFATVAVEL